MKKNMRCILAFSINERKCREKCRFFKLGDSCDNGRGSFVGILPIAFHQVSQYCPRLNITMCVFTQESNRPLAAAILACTPKWLSGSIQASRLLPVVGSPPGRMGPVVGLLLCSPSVSHPRCIAQSFPISAFHVPLSALLHSAIVTIAELVLGGLQFLNSIVPSR